MAGEVICPICGQAFMPKPFMAVCDDCLERRRDRIHRQTTFDHAWGSVQRAIRDARSFQRQYPTYADAGEMLESVVSALEPIYRRMTEYRASIHSITADEDAQIYAAASSERSGGDGG